MLKRSTMSAIVALGLFLCAAGAARAQVLNDTLGGGPLTISTLLFSDPPRVNPSVFGLRASAGDCVRVEGTSSSFDAEFTIVAPDGQVYRDNDVGAGNKPLVKIGGAENGIYTLVIHVFAGQQIRTGLITFTYERFNGGAGNVNCQPPTPPR